MKALAVLNGATKLCRSMHSQAELSCRSIVPAKASPPVCTTAHRPENWDKTISYIHYILFDNERN